MASVVRNDDIAAIRQEIERLERQLEAREAAAVLAGKIAGPAGIADIDQELIQRRRYLSELRADLEALLQAPDARFTEPLEIGLRASSVADGLAIVIGHSPEGDMGAEGLAPPFAAGARDGRAEYYWNKDLAERIKRKAEACGVRAEIFHRMRNGSVGVREAYRQAELWGPKAAIELHFNCANGTARGSETLYGRDGSRAWATALQQRMVALYGRTGRLDRGIKNAHETGRGIQSVDNAVQPTALIEPFFGDNRDDAELGIALKDGLADAILEAYRTYVGVQAPAGPPVAPPPVASLWDKLREAYSSTPIEFPQLKGITYAQWALESGRGTSPLAQQHLNFAGMKWRNFMADLCDKTWYEAHDGGDYYCKFATLEKFIAGYWARLDRHPAYSGWRQHTASPEAFFRFIADIWAPPAGNPNYVGKVLSLYASLEAEGKLPTAGVPAAVAVRPEAAIAARPATAAPGEIPSDEEFWPDRTEEAIALRNSAESQISATVRATAESGVKWAADEDSCDYAHLESTLPINMQFTLTAADLELLCALNDFPVDEAGATPVLFGLRGAAIVDGSSAVDGARRREVVLKNIRPNHHEIRCVIGAWNRAKGTIAVYPGSTVPHAEAVVNWYRTKEAGNLMPTGLYRYIGGVHNGKPGCFLLRQSIDNRRKAIVRRTANNMTYESVDIFQNMAPGNNIHPSFSSETGWFSSMGCQVIVGSATPTGRHSGPWAKFRESAGQEDAYGAPGKPYLYVLLTGQEALIASQLRRAGQAGDAAARLGLRRLRFGSKGAAVTALQQKLGLASCDGDFGPNTAEAFYKRQASLAQSRCDGIYTPKLDAALGWGVFAEPVPVASGDGPVAVVAA